MNYKVSNDIIIFAPEFNKSFDEYNDLLIGLKKIIFSNYVLNEITCNYYLISSNLWKFNYYSNCNVDNGDCELSTFNYPVDNLPPNITHIYFSDDFSQSVDNLPQNLTHLHFGFNFNQSISNLPLKLIYLYLGYYFNQPISNLPSSLTYLALNYSFTHSVSNLPPNLTHIIFGNKFSQLIDSLPSSLIYLNLGVEFSQPVDLLPSSLIYLKLGRNFSYSLNNLPQGIKIIKFDAYSLYNNDLNCLPNSIQEIKLPLGYSKHIVKIPTQLKKITCHEKYIGIDYLKNIGINVSTYKSFGHVELLD